MLRRVLGSALAPALILMVGVEGARGADDPRFAADFIQGLRERGYYDVVVQYLDRLRQDPATPAEIRATLDFEEGRTLIEEATHAADPDVSKVKLDQAKGKIEAFVKANPDLPQTTEALVDLARLLHERGLNESDLAGEARDAAEKEAKLASARGYFESARGAYARAFEKLNARLVAFPRFIPPTTPARPNASGPGSR